MDIAFYTSLKDSFFEKTLLRVRRAEGGGSKNSNLIFLIYQDHEGYLLLMMIYIIKSILDHLRIPTVLINGNKPFRTIFED